MNNTIELSNMYELALFPKRNFIATRGEGALLWDDQDKQYIDCAGASGSVNVGHCHARVVRAIQEQAAKLICCTGIFHHELRSKVCERLISLAPKNLRKVFLCNSGTESIEAALKFARISTGRHGFIATVRGFHGRTLGALSATHNPKYREGFEPLVPGFTHVPFNDIAALSAVVTSETAGVILEIVQGEGGVYLAEAEYLRQAQALCRERGAMLIVDEVQTGFCRTGKMFACEHSGLEPDILCLAKSIAGGVPLGATLCADSVRIHIGSHGTTFGGSPIGCAAALASIDVMIDEHLAENAAEKGDYFGAKLRAIVSPKIREVRQLGLMIGVQLKERSTSYLQALMEEGVLAIPAGPTVMRYLPPLVISKAQIDRVVEKTALVLSRPAT